MGGRFREPKLYGQAPSVCTKPGCGGKVIVTHEDGWQCFRCMKIIYKAYERVGSKVFVKRYAHDKNLGE